MTSANTMNVRQVAARFELAQQEKWFEIQDELFAEDVRELWKKWSGRSRSILRR